MWPISDRLARSLVGEHETTTRILALPVLGGEPTDLSAFFAGGQLSVTRQEIRRAGSITLQIDPGDQDLIPRTPDDLLAPYGQELIIETGVVFPDGTEELVPQGVFRIVQPRIRYPQITLDLKDRAWTVAGARLENTYTIAKGTPYHEAILALLAAAYPQIEADFIETGFTTPQLVLDAQADPWHEAQQMAGTVGHQLYFDRLGVCRLEPESDQVSADPVWSFDDASLEFIPRGDEHWSNLATYDMTLEYDTAETYNAVVATGENTDNDTPFRGVARDLDPSSPTFWGGRYGKRPMFWSSPLITSGDQAQLAAVTRLQKQLGIEEGITVPLAATHPALDLTDPVLLVRRELGINQVHLVDDFNLPLRADGAQQIATRRRKVVLGE